MKKKIYCASISGGKDSVCMCLELIRRGWVVDYFIFCDTGVEFPECYDALAKFEKDTGREVVRLRNPKGDFYYWCCNKPVKPRNPLKADGTPKRPAGYGWPSISRRWCTSALKTEPLKKFYKSLGDVEIIEYVGIAADEPKRIKGKVYPLVSWGMTEEDCMAYCKERGYYKSPCAYDHVKRMSCFLCPCTSNKNAKYLYDHRPELWKKIEEVEEKLQDQWMSWKGRDKDGNFVGTRFLKRKFISQNNQMEFGL